MSLNINYTITLPKEIVIHSVSQKTPERSQAAAVSGIWDAFVKTLRSFLCCFNLGGKKISAEARENRLPIDDAEILRRLDGQKERARQQMQKERAHPSFKPKYPRGGYPIHEETVGPYRVGITHNIGRRKTMEDEHLTSSFTVSIAGTQYPIQLFGIFDGHGGREAAIFARDNLQRHLVQTLQQYNPNGLNKPGIWRALKKAFINLNAEFKQKGAVAQRQGSTATVAMILDNKLWTANVGDSRTIMNDNGTAYQLTEDAKPGNPYYEKCIEQRGGWVEDLDCPRVKGQLAVARAIGDHGLKGAISARPKITVMDNISAHRNAQLILACDGIWDVARTVDVANLVQGTPRTSPGFHANNIVHSALRARSGDNLSAMVVQL